jgi:hypothetical protein
MLVIAGCAGSAPVPPASDNIDYTDSRFLRAEGMGATNAEAQRQAMAAMANIFESKVYNYTVSKAQSAIDASNAETFSRTVENEIRVESSVRLQGVKIGKTWQDQTTGAFHALAVLDRFQARQQWAGDMETIDALIDGQFKAVDAAQGNLERLQALNSVMSLWLKREVVNSRLRVIGFADIDAPPYNLKDVTRAIAEIRSALRIYVEVGGDGGATATDRVGEQLTGDGYRLAGSVLNADVSVTGTVSTEDVALNNPDVVFIRATATVSVTDDARGVTLYEVRESARKGHVDKQEADRKAVNAVSSQIASRISRFFSQGRPAETE